VKRLSDGRVEITSMNHGFAVDTETLPATARPTHISLFDGTLAGLELTRPTRRSACNITPKPAPGRRTASICSRSVHEYHEELEAECCSQAPAYRRTAKTHRGCFSALSDCSRSLSDSNRLITNARLDEVPEPAPLDQN
jgi:hypothetical protein